MYHSFSTDRKDFRYTITQKAANGQLYQKHTTRWIQHYIHHQIVQDIVTHNFQPALSDIVLANKPLRYGSYSKVATRYQLSNGQVGTIFKKAFNLERIKLKNLGYQLPENNVTNWSRV